MALTAKQRLFVAEYLVCLTAETAAVKAGYTPSSAQKNAHRLLDLPEIAAAIAEGMAARIARTEITQDMVLQRWWDIATADPRDLVEYRRTCCRHCWGADHAYQWTAQEFAAATTKAEQAETKTLPDPSGGLDFDRTRDPSPDCPECRGEGRGDVRAADTRRLRDKAKLLYAGAKQGKDGLEIKLHDQAKALENVARHLGMFKDRVEHSGPEGGPIEVNDARERIASRLARLSGSDTKG